MGQYGQPNLALAGVLVMFLANNENINNNI